VECDARSQEGLGASLVQESGSQFARQTHMSVDTYHAERDDSPPRPRPPRGPAGARRPPSARRVLRSREPRVRRGAGPPSCGDETRDHAPRRRARGRFGICSETQARKPYSLPWSGNISSPLPNSPGERHGERTVVARSAPRQGQRDRAHGTTRSVARAHLLREGLGEHGARAALGDGRGR